MLYYNKKGSDFVKNYRKLTADQLDGVFALIGKGWMLITAKGRDEQGNDVVNTMTASWGGLGFLWHRPVAFCFVRPQRYTYTFTEQAERFSLTFFDEKYRDALRLCGTKSGRELDKFAATGLTPIEVDGVPAIAQARLTLICRKLYADDLRENGFLDQTLLKNYTADDYHRVYVVEIEQILESEED